MDHEIIINNGRKSFKAFFQNGFYFFDSPSKIIHKHSYTEVHIIANGNTTFDIGGKQYVFESGSVISIPSGTFHYCIDSSEGLLHAAYQIDCKQDEVSTYNVGNDMVLRFMEKINECKSSHNYSVIASYISLFLSYFSANERLEAKEVTDYGFLIHEFFSIHYNEDIHLRDIANYLHLSERQSERLIIDYTGHSFRDELVATRMNMAKILFSTTDMSLSEISQYVGYKSYNGFWKAAKKFNFFDSNR